MRAATFALLTFLMMNLSVVNACESHEGALKERSKTTPVPSPNPN